MISIYQIKANYGFSKIMPSERSFDKPDWTSLLGFNGESKTDAWDHKRYCYVPEPNRPLGDFASFARNIVIRAETFNRTDQLSYFFNKYNAELLTLIDEYEGIEWYAINMIYVPNCIDRERSVLSIRPYKRKLEFIPSRIMAKQNVFSTWWPESVRGKLLCWEENQDPHSEFKAYIEQSGLTGLEFELLWDEEKGGRMFTAKMDPHKGLVIRNEDE